jgi:hypothetical protein
MQHEAAAIAFLDALVEQRKAVETNSRSIISFLVENHNAGNIDEQSFIAQMREISQKEDKFFNGDVALQRLRDKILVEIDEIVLESYTHPETMAESLLSYASRISTWKTPLSRRRKPEHIRWNRILFKYYDAEDSREQFWCPITKWFGNPLCRITAHIVPNKICYQTMGAIFGGDGHALMWSMGNGLLINRDYIDGAFEDFRFCLLPRERDGMPDDVQLVLVEESLRDRHYSQTRTWDEFDGTFLEFRAGCNARPDSRFLFFHYWMCLIKSQREMIPGWKEVRERVNKGELWTVPGKDAFSLIALSFFL